jgi:very-short-patch-repair endonuclease
VPFLTRQLEHYESAYDAARTEWLEARGFVIVRFWNNEVLGNLDIVLDTIAAHIPRDEL